MLVLVRVVASWPRSQLTSHVMALRGLSRQTRPRTHLHEFVGIDLASHTRMALSTLADRTLVLDPQGGVECVAIVSDGVGVVRARRSPH